MDVRALTLVSTGRTQITPRMRLAVRAGGASEVD